MAYSATPPALVQRTSADGLVIGNTLVLNSTGNLNPLGLAAELKGGLHYVEYLEYLNENSYRGISIGRREVGMLAYVAREWANGADTVLGKYYTLKSLAGNGVGTWEAFTGGSTAVTTNQTYAAATIAARNALPGLVEGDIVVVADASGDTTVVPALTGGATYVYTAEAGNLWLRFLFPTDPALAKAHDQNTDVRMKVVRQGQADTFLESTTIQTHLDDATIHFKINDGNATGSLAEVYSSAKLKAEFLQKNPAGDVNKFFNERGEAVTVQTNFTITRINGGTPSTIFPA
ncbi:hypothetical protein [Hymenobacter tenuis]